MLMVLKSILEIVALAIPAYWLVTKGYQGDWVYHVKNDPPGVMTPDRVKILAVIMSTPVDGINWRASLKVAEMFNTAGCTAAYNQIISRIHDAGFNT
jgi:hypothetical protein